MSESLESPPVHPSPDEEEKIHLKGLELFINSSQNDFAINGSIGEDDLDMSTLALYFMEPQADSDVVPEGSQSEGTPIRVAFPLSDTDCQRLFAAGEPSPHGVGRETVLDESYRQAHELRVRWDRLVQSFKAECHVAFQQKPNFSLSDDIISLSGVINSLPVQISNSIRTRLYKLNVYGPGGFFKTHRE